MDGLNDLFRLEKGKEEVKKVKGEPFTFQYIGAESVVRFHCAKSVYLCSRYSDQLSLFAASQQLAAITAVATRKRGVSGSPSSNGIMSYFVFCAERKC